MLQMSFFFFCKWFLKIMSYLQPFCKWIIGQCHSFISWATILFYVDVNLYSVIVELSTRTDVPMYLSKYCRRPEYLLKFYSLKLHHEWSHQLCKTLRLLKASIIWSLFTYSSYWLLLQHDQCLYYLLYLWVRSRRKFNV